MADGLALTYQALRRILGTHAGWGGDDGNWSTEQKRTAEDIFREGMRRAYYPVDGRGRAVRWSCLTPTRSLVTVADQSDYDMPEDFDGITGPMSYSSADSGVFPVQLVSEQTVLNRRQYSSDGSSGPPEMVALEQAPPGTATGTRFRLLLWPTPNDVYTLSYRCVIVPQPVGPANQVPPGGPRISGLLKAAVLAEYESRFNDGQTQWNVLFMQELAAAIAQDAALEPDQLYPSVQSRPDSAWTNGMPAVRWRPGQVRFTLDD